MRHGERTGHVGESDAKRLDLDFPGRSLCLGDVPRARLCQPSVPFCLRKLTSSARFWERIGWGVLPAPGLREALVAVDADETNFLDHPVKPESEVHLLMAIAGGG